MTAQLDKKCPRYEGEQYACRYATVTQRSPTLFPPFPSSDIFSSEC